MLQALWEHSSVATFTTEASKKRERWMKESLRGSSNYVPRETEFYIHQRSPQQSLAEPWQVFTAICTHLSSVYRRHLAHYTCAVSCVKWENSRSTRVLKWNLSLNVLYEFRAEIMVRVAARQPPSHKKSWNTIDTSELITIHTLHKEKHLPLKITCYT